MTTSTPDSIRAAVRQAYGAVATATHPAGGCCGGTSCCGSATSTSSRLGYAEADLKGLPDGADLGLGCGNPQAIAALKPGERVLDLGSGAGFDALLAARQVGPGGSVIGVDLTPEMIDKARGNAARAGLPQVEFRLGDIEQLPVADGSVDVIMSNCVINLAPDKAAVFREAFRVLAPGGRLAISDVVAIGALPAAFAAEPTAYTSCVTGAARVADLERLITSAGFTAVRVTVQEGSRELAGEWLPGSGAGQAIASASIEAVKPVGASADGPGTACCDAAAQLTCCEAAGKAACCGDAPTAASPVAGPCGCSTASSHRARPAR